MTKIYEELTEDWKAGKLHKRFDEPKLFYCKTDNGIEILKTWGYKNLEFLSMADEVFEPVDDVQVLAHVPTYDEYKAMQAELAEHRHYCCCSENEVMRLKLAEMEELLKECLPIVSAEIMTWQIRGGEESYKRGQNLLTRINTALGGSEVK